MKRWQKVTIWIGLFPLLALGLILTPGWAKEKVVIVGDNANHRTLDPAFIGVTQDIQICRSIYQGLLRYKKNSFEFEGDLAKSWTKSKDGLICSFKLREGINWHKGFGKFTAKDVKYTFDRVLDPKTGAANRSEFVADIQEVRVLDDYTVEFRLTSPTPGFLHKLVGPRGSAIVSQQAVEKFGKDYGRNPIGTGPFVFVSWTREQVVLAGNKDFQQREGPPKIDKLIYRVIPDVDTLLLALQNGEVDIVFVMPRELAIMDRLKAADCKVIYRKSPTSLNLMMNNKKKPFDDIRVRQAIAHAIDKDAISKHIFGGIGERLDNPYPQGLYGHTEKGLLRYDYNPEKAKELLAQAGYPNGFEINLDTSPSPTHRPACIAISEQLRKVNINAKLIMTDQATWWGKFSKATTDFTTLVITWQAAPELSLLRYFHSSAFSPGINVCRYDKIDGLIEKVRKEESEEKRIEIHHQIQKQFMEDIPSVPIMKLYYPIGYRSHLSGVSELDYMHWGDDFYSLTVGEKK